MLPTLPASCFSWSPTHKPTKRQNQGSALLEPFSQFLHRLWVFSGASGNPGNWGATLCNHHQWKETLQATGLQSWDLTFQNGNRSPGSVASRPKQHTGSRLPPGNKRLVYSNALNGGFNPHLNHTYSGIKQCPFLVPETKQFKDTRLKMLTYVPHLPSAGASTESEVKRHLMKEEGWVSSSSKAPGLANIWSALLNC